MTRARPYLAGFGVAARIVCVAAVHSWKRKDKTQVVFNGGGFMVGKSDVERVDRVRLYALLDALEAGVREILDRWVVAELGEPAAFGPELLAKATERAARDAATGAGEGSLLDFLDLGDELGLLGTHSDQLPADLSRPLLQLTPSLHRLVGARNRVMHGRPLHPEDGDLVVSTCREAIAHALPLDDLRGILQRLDSEPEWAPAIGLPPPLVARVLHNLPLPDYDETGLVGRAKEVRELLQLLRSRRSPVVTIVGPGGVGKTALALESLYQLIDAPGCPYELVVWHSLKSETLDTEGVRRLREPVTSLLEIVEDLARPMDGGFEGDVGELGAALEDIKALIVIDNIETVDGEDVVQFVDAMPATCSFLFTSRVGIGQLEKRFPVAGLESRAAGGLLRQFAKRRGLDSMARLPEKEIDRITHILHGAPLGIRWYVMSVDAGQDPQALLLRRDSLVRFCVQSVAERLSPRAQDVATALKALGRPMSLPDLVLSIDVGLDEVRSGVLELQRACLLGRVGSGMFPQFELTSVANDYMSTIGPPSAASVEKIKARDAQLRQSEEARQLEENSRKLGPGSVVLESPEQKPAAHLLREALRASRVGDFVEALIQVARAKELMPHYFEVANVEARILSHQGRLQEADASYERALSLAPENQRPRINYFFASHLAHAKKEPGAALPRAKDAHDGLLQPDTANLLGRIFMYLHRWADAESMLAWAISVSTGKARLISSTSMVDLWGRKAEEYAASEHRYLDAVKACRAGLSIAMDALASGSADARLWDAAASVIAIGLRACMRLSSLQGVESELDSFLEVIGGRAPEMAKSKSWPYVIAWTRRMLEAPAFASSLSKHRSRLASLCSPEDQEKESSAGAKRGVIGRYIPSRHFGFITTERGESLFFHETALVNPGEAIMLLAGVAVQYEEAVGKRGRVAVSLLVVPDAAQRDSALQARRLSVRSVLYDKRYAFLTDDLTGVDVFAHETEFALDVPWSEVRAGGKFIASLTLKDGGRCGVVKYSVRRDVSVPR